MENRSGKYITNLSGEMQYQSFCPAPLPPDLEMDPEMIFLLTSAHKQLALLEGLTSRIPDLQLFVSMYVRKEALLSSQIEGTQATLEDVFNPAISENTNRDVVDVINYIRATEYAIDRLSKLPLCNRLIRETHAVLMENVRGQEKSPGEFRYSQNWIGGQGSTLRNARYIPPNPEDMLTALSDLENFIHAEDDLDPLIKAGLIHYQFETIHPFLDGNGRIGRLMITLYLMENKLLSSPALYLSYFLKQNRIEYYDRMSEVRRTGNYEQWVKFFLRATSEAAKDAIQSIDKLSALHSESLKQIDAFYPERTRKNALILFNFLEKNPIVDIQKTAAALSLAPNTVSKFITDFCALGLLQESDKVGKAKIYAYAAYLDILRKDT